MCIRGFFGEMPFIRNPCRPNWFCLTFFPECPILKHRMQSKRRRRHAMEGILGTSFDHHPTSPYSDPSLLEGRDLLAGDCATIFLSTAQQNSAKEFAIIRAADAVPMRRNAKISVILLRGCITRVGIDITLNIGVTIIPSQSASIPYACPCDIWQKCSATVLQQARSIIKSAMTLPVRSPISRIPQRASVVNCTRKLLMNLWSC